MAVTYDDSEDVGTRYLLFLTIKYYCRSSSSECKNKAWSLYLSRKSRFVTPGTILLETRYLPT